MPLRHLTLHEPQYVPQYNTLDSATLNTANQSITQQSLMAREKRDHFTQINENVTKQLSNLGEEDQMYVQNSIARSQQNINEAVDKYGGRDSVSHVMKESERLQEDLKHHNAISAHRNQAIEKLNENEELPTNIAHGLLASEYGVEYDENGKAMGTYGEINASQLRVAANWENWDDDLHKHVMSLDPNSEDHFGAQDPYTNDRYVATLKQLGVDRIYKSGLDYLLSNDKYREQLELAGNLQHDQHNQMVEAENAERKALGEKLIDSSIKKLSNGRVAVTQDVPVLGPDEKPIEEGKNEFGEPIYKMEKKTTTYNSFAEWQATNEVSKFSQHGVRELSFKHRSAAGDGDNISENLLSNRFTRLVSLEREVTSGKEYLSTIRDEAIKNEEMGHNLRKVALNRLPGSISEDSTIDFDHTTGSFIFSFETEDGQMRGNHTIGDLVEKGLIDEPTRRRLVQDEKSHRKALTKQNRLAGKYNEIKNVTINELATEFGNFSNFLYESGITDEGEFELEGLSAEAREEIYSDGKRIYGARIPDSQSLKNEASKEPILMEVPVQRQRGNTTSDQMEEVLVTYSDGEWDVRTYDHTLNKLAKRRDEVLNERAKELGGHFEHTAMILEGGATGRDEDKRIIESIAYNPNQILDNGDLTDRQGNTVSIDQFNKDEVIPTDVFLKDGQPHMSLTYREDGVGEPQRLLWTGATVTDMVRNALGHENVQDMLLQMSVDDWISSVMGGQTQYRIDGSELQDLGIGLNTPDGFKTFDAIDLSVKTRRNTATGKVEKDIHYTIPGTNIKYTAFDTPDIIQSLDNNVFRHFGQQEE